jgi:hypothetical protein
MCQREFAGVPEDGLAVLLLTLVKIGPPQTMKTLWLNDSIEFDERWTTDNMDLGVAGYSFF